MKGIELKLTQVELLSFFFLREYYWHRKNSIHIEMLNVDLEDVRVGFI